MATQKIDLGESYGDMGIAPAKPKTKYYPSLTVPVKVDPAMVGKDVTVQITGKVVSVSENSREGEKAKARFEMEMHSIALPKTAKGKGDSRYVKPWMNEVK